MEDCKKSKLLFTDENVKKFWVDGFKIISKECHSGTYGNYIGQ